jgi:hypothetical protein
MKKFIGVMKMNVYLLTYLHRLNLFSGGYNKLYIYIMKKVNLIFNFLIKHIILSSFKGID